MTLKCKEITAVLGCWTNAGVATPVIIYTEFRENAAGNPVPHATRYTLSDGTPVAATAATVVPGACASAVEFDTLALCDPATLLPVFIVTRYSPLGVPTSAAFNPDGTPYPGPINGLVSCDTIDLESDALEMCDGGATSFVRWVVKRNGVPTGVSFDTTLGLAPYVPTGVVTVGRCAAAIEPDFSHTVTVESGCANGVPWSRRTTYDWQETLAGPSLNAANVDYVNSSGTGQVAVPAGFTLGACPNDSERSDTIEQGCANGVPFSRVRTVITFNGTVVSQSFAYRNSAGVDTPTMPVGFTLGACPLSSTVSHTEAGCAGGVDWTRRTTLVRDALNNITATLISYIDSSGAVQAAAPVGFLLGACSLSARVYRTIVQDVAPTTTLAIFPLGTLVGWTIRNRNSTTGTLQVNAGAILPLDTGETISSGGIEENRGELGDVLNVVAGNGTVRVTTIRRV